MPHPFHLALPVHDLDAARRFYIGLLGCREGRSGDGWVDLDFFGHQVVAHVVDGGGGRDCLVEVGENAINGRRVPLPHFGAVLPMEQWKSLADSLAEAGTEFLIEPQVRYEGEINEQASLFLRDPSGNTIELKAFADLGRLFAKDGVEASDVRGDAESGAL